MATVKATGTNALPNNYGENVGAGFPGLNGKMETDNNVTSTGTANVNSNTSGSQQNNSTGLQNSAQTTVNNSTTTNMSPTALAALNRLITQLQNGGTPEQQHQKAIREGEQTNVGNLRSQYDKASAFKDASGLIAQQMRRALESMLPSINRAAEDAGSSGGALRALLLQDAADKAAESSSALGVQTATAYGGVAANLSNTLEALTRPDNSVTNALINALGTAKGAVSNTTGTSTTTGQTFTQQQANQTNNQTQQQQSTENKMVNTDYAPFAVNTTPQFFGNSVDDLAKIVKTVVGTSGYNMSQLSGQSSPWSSYQF